MEELVKAILGLKISTDIKTDLLAILNDELIELRELDSEALKSSISQKLKAVGLGLGILAEGIPVFQVAKFVHGIAKGAEQEPEGASTGTRIAIRCRQCPEVVYAGERGWR